MELIIIADQITPALREFLSQEGATIEDPRERAFDNLPEGFHSVTPTLLEEQEKNNEARWEALAAALRAKRQDLGIKTAYAAPDEVPAVQPSMLPPTPTRPLRTDQIYLDPTPDGISAQYAWNQPGGKGTGIKIADLEWAWRLNHEAFSSASVTINGTPSTNSMWEDHGTAILGLLVAQHTGNGISGICPEVEILAVSLYQRKVTQAVLHIVRQGLVTRGDILLIEAQAAWQESSQSVPIPPGCEITPGVTTVGQGYIPVEWWPDRLAAIREACSDTYGIIVVAAAGNGLQDLDDPALAAAGKAQFDPDNQGIWENPFDMHNSGSGAILVGAGSPKLGTFYQYRGQARSRLWFSNFGQRVIAQGWGRDVVTAGYGQLQRGADKNRWYTNAFGGTSSAAAIVAGALACVQGYRKANGRSLLTPARAYELLQNVNTGAAQQDDDPVMPLRPKSQHIGNLPDLEMLMKVSDDKWPQ